MPVKMLINLVNQIKDIIHARFGILDDAGIVIACSEESLSGTVQEKFNELVESRESVAVLNGRSFKKVYVKNKLEYVVFIEGTSEESLKYLSLIALHLANIKLLSDEKYDKAVFIKNILTGSISAGDISIRARELHIQASAWRVALLIRTESTREVPAHEVLEGMFPNKAKDFIVVLDEEHTVLIKELKNAEEQKEVEKIAKSIIDTLGSELMIRAFIGVGTAVESLKDLVRSFREARVALIVGEIFENERYVLNYNRLGIGRLVYQLPLEMCTLFLKEVFHDDSFDALDAETLLTIQKFFENDLNVSETSRQLYVHRNTLVYRLEKIKRITGLDLAKFDDAITFKVAMLVKRYVDNYENINGNV